MEELHYYYQDPELLVRHVTDQRPDNKDFTLHVHDQCELYFFLSGKTSYLVEGTEYPLSPECLLLMRPMESHKAQILESVPYERYTLNFSAGLTDRLDPEHRLLEPFTQRQNGRGNLYLPREFQPGEVRAFFEAICRPREDPYGRRLQILSCLFPLLSRIRQAYLGRRGQEELPPSPAEQMVAYVNAHLFDELSVPALAERFYMSVSQFERSFRKAAGSSVWEYITVKRLTEARNRIRSGSGAQKASQECGFGEYSTFYRAYVKRFGCAPTGDGPFSGL